MIVADYKSAERTNVMNIQIRVNGLVRIPVPASVQATSSHPAIVEASVANGTLSLTAKTMGLAVVTVSVNGQAFWTINLSVVNS